MDRQIEFVAERKPQGFVGLVVEVGTGRLIRRTSNTYRTAETARSVIVSEWRALQASRPREVA